VMEAELMTYRSNRLWNGPPYSVPS
jgi:hypothetical protein